MDEDYIRHRVDQIMRQKIAMGGCDDMYGYGGGVLIGGKGPSAKSKAAWKKNPWNLFIEYYMKRHGLNRSEVINYPGIGAIYRRSKFYKGEPAKKKRPARAAVTRRTYQSLNARQRARVGLRYKSRVKKGPNKGSCFKEEEEGPYYLDRRYVCQYKPLKKKR